MMDDSYGNALIDGEYWTMSCGFNGPKLISTFVFERGSRYSQFDLRTSPHLDVVVAVFRM